MNNKPIFVLAFILIAGFNANVVFADDYKCYVKARDGNHYIVFNEANSADDAEKTARSQKVLVGTPRPLSVTQVLECQPLSSAFSSSAANNLAAETPQ